MQQCTFSKCHWSDNPACRRRRRRRRPIYQQPCVSIFQSTVDLLRRICRQTIARNEVEEEEEEHDEGRKTLFVSRPNSPSVVNSSFRTRWRRIEAEEEYRARKSTRHTRPRRNCSSVQSAECRLIGAVIGLAQSVLIENQFVYVVYGGKVNPINLSTLASRDC